MWPFVFAGVFFPPPVVLALSVLYVLPSTQRFLRCNPPPQFSYLSCLCILFLPLIRICDESPPDFLHNLSLFESLSPILFIATFVLHARLKSYQTVYTAATPAPHFGLPKTDQSGGMGAFTSHISSARMPFGDLKVFPFLINDPPPPLRMPFGDTLGGLPQRAYEGLVDLGHGALGAAQQAAGRGPGNVMDGVVTIRRDGA